MSALHSLKIAVAYGGIGAEREISLISGDAVYQALARDGKNISRAELTSGSIAPLEKGNYDLVFLALHGEFGEDGGAQTLLEQAKIPYTGSGAAASRLAMNKFASKQKFREYGVPVADGIRVSAAESLATIREKLRAAKLNPPLAVKPNGRGSSVGITMVRAETELESALAAAWRCDRDALIEKFVGGREITAGLLDGVCLPLVEACVPRGFYDYQAKYFTDAVEYFCPARLAEPLAAKIQTLAQTVWRALDLRDLARVDFILDNENAAVLEANTLPGFTPHSLLPKAALAAGADFSALCWRIVETAARRCKLL